MIATYDEKTGALEIFDKLDADGGWVIRQPHGVRYWELEEVPQFGGTPQLIGEYASFGLAYAKAKELT